MEAKEPFFKNNMGHLISRKKNRDFRLVGLPNNSNSCYINSVMQCLYNSSYFKNLIFESEYTGELLNYLKMIFSDLDKGIYRKWKPSYLLSIINKASKSKYQDFDQNDAHEFINTFIDTLYQEFQRYSTEEKKSNPIENMFITEVSIINPSCQEKTNNTNKLCCHIFPVADSIQNTVTRLDSSTLISHCKACEEEEKHILVPKMHTTPNIFTFALKRVVVDDKTTTFKNFNEVEIEQEIIFFNCKYVLNSLIYHYGMTVYSGHYIAYCKKGDTWYEYDDELVKELDSNRFERELSASKSTYILFYEKQN